MKKRSKLLIMLLALCFLLQGCAGTTPGSEGTTANADTTKEAVTNEPTAPEMLELKYDDRYSFGKAIKDIVDQTVTSKKINSNDADTAVLSVVDAETGKVRATGTGTATVLFNDGTQEKVEVKTAAISLLLLIGQSNTEGMIGSGPVDDARIAAFAEACAQSVASEEGQVYSTYAPGYRDQNVGMVGSLIGNASFEQVLKYDNAERFVAESLTSDKALMGNNLEYKLNALTEAGTGKAGIDSALAYTWAKQTGEKVWIVNAAHSGSAINTWLPMSVNDNYTEAANVLKACQKVLKAETAAGHFSLSYSGYFWLQGCADNTKNCAQYTTLLRMMHEGFSEEFAYDYGNGKVSMDFGGILMVRAATAGSAMSTLDVDLNGPRLAQYLSPMETTGSFANLVLASSVGDRWVTNAGVQNYFNNKYPGGKLSYPTRTDYRLPTTMQEVHPDIHYRQKGYNELGADAASNVISFLRNERDENTNVTMYKADGYSTYANGQEIAVRADVKLRMVPVVTPSYMTCFGLTVTTSEGFTYQNGVLMPDASLAAGTVGTLTVSLDGKEVLTFTLKVAG